MSTIHVKLGGSDRPVRFGMAALYEYERRTGRKADRDFAAQSDGRGSITLLVDIALSALICGHRYEKLEIDFDEYTVADWIGEDMSVVDVIMGHFADSFPDAKEDSSKKKKASSAK